MKRNAAMAENGLISTDLETLGGKKAKLQKNVWPAGQTHICAQLPSCRRPTFYTRRTGRRGWTFPVRHDFCRKNIS